MAQEAGLSSTFPPPPLDLIDKYTDEAVKGGIAPKPPVMLDAHYRMFGNVHSADDSIILPLDEQPGMKRLYPEVVDHKQQIEKLTLSAVACFLDLLDLLIRCPEHPQRQQKVRDLQMHFFNIHHLINEYRPHQAREALRALLIEQKNRKLTIANKFEQYYQTAVRKLEECVRSLPPRSGGEGLAPCAPNSVDMLAEVELQETGDTCHALDRLMCSIADSME